MQENLGSDYIQDNSPRGFAKRIATTPNSHGRFSKRCDNDTTCWRRQTWTDDDAFGSTNGACLRGFVYLDWSASMGAAIEPPMLKSSLSNAPFC